jgi:hypothetical protein
VSDFVQLCYLLLTHAAYSDAARDTVSLIAEGLRNLIAGLPQGAVRSAGALMKQLAAGNDVSALFRDGLTLASLMMVHWLLQVPLARDDFDAALKAVASEPGTRIEMQGRDRIVVMGGAAQAEAI